MTEKDIRRRIHSALDNGLNDVHADPFLAARVIETATGEHKMKKKLAFTPLIALLLLALCLIAYAAGSNIGISALLNDLWHRDIPEGALDYISESPVTLETDKALLTVTETYYDGTALIFTADVKAKAEKTLLLGFDLTADDPIHNLTGANDSMSISSFFADNGYENALYTDIYPAEWDDISDITLNYRLAPDGTLKYILGITYYEPADTREAAFILLTADTDESLDQIESSVTRSRFDLNPVSGSSSYPVHESITPVEVKGAGIRIDRLTIQVTPLQLCYRIEYSVTDPKIYEPHEDSLFMTFIDPDSPETDIWLKVLKSGILYVCNPESIEKNSYMQTGSIALEEMRNTWTIIVYDPFMDGKPILDTVTITTE